MARDEYGDLDFYGRPWAGTRAWFNMPKDEYDAMKKTEYQSSYAPFVSLDLGGGDDRRRATAMADAYDSLRRIEARSRKRKEAQNSLAPQK